LCSTGAFYFGTQSQLHFSGRLLGERDGDDTIESAFSIANERDDATN
jgi:hypothetical protein